MEPVGHHGLDELQLADEGLGLHFLYGIVGLAHLAELVGQAGGGRTPRAGAIGIQALATRTARTDGAVVGGLLFHAVLALVPLGRRRAISSNWS